MYQNLTINQIRAAYGIGDYAICLYWSGVGLYLLYFYTDVVGITPLLAGWVYALGIAKWIAGQLQGLDYADEALVSSESLFIGSIFYLLCMI